MTTPTLMTVGRMEPRRAIGSVSLSELLVAVAATLGFLTHLGADQVDWAQVAALLCGAIVVAPLAAWVVKVMPARVLGAVVGALIVVLNLATVLTAVGAAPAVTVVLVVAAGLGSVALVVRAVGISARERRLARLVEPHAGEGGTVATSTGARDA